jgi:hypothetical protein
MRWRYCTTAVAEHSSEQYFFTPVATKSLEQMPHFFLRTVFIFLHASLTAA